MKKLIALTVTAVLLAAALIGCGGGGDELAPYVAYWDGVTIESEVGDFPISEEEGLDINIDLKEDGEAVFEMYDTENEFVTVVGTWEITENEEILLTADDDYLRGEFYGVFEEEDTMTLMEFPDEGMSILFLRTVG